MFFFFFTFKYNNTILILFFINGLLYRHKVKELIDFIQDDDKLREERKKSKKNKDKYVGMSSDVMGMRLGMISFF